MITLVSKEKRQIVGYDIAYDKSSERIQRLLDKSPKAEQYYSYAYSAYSEVCYDGTHKSLKNKSETYTVEGVNSDLRSYIAPLHRKSKCFFRSIDNAKAVLKIFVHAFNKFVLSKFLQISLKSTFLFNPFCVILNRQNIKGK